MIYNPLATKTNNTMRRSQMANEASMPFIWAFESEWSINFITITCIVKWSIVPSLENRCALTLKTHF